MRHYNIKCKHRKPNKIKSAILASLLFPAVPTMAADDTTNGLEDYSRELGTILVWDILARIVGRV